MSKDATTRRPVTVSDHELWRATGQPAHVDSELQSLLEHLRELERQHKERK